MDRLEDDLILVKGCVEELSDYLDSKEMFWQLSTPGTGERKTLTLTIGNLLLSMNRIGKMSVGISGQIADIQAIRQNRKTAWILKCAKEFNVRIKLWAQALRELFSEGLKTSYSEMVGGRVILELLQIELLSERAAYSVVKAQIPSLDEQLDLLKNMDQQLKSLPTGEFVWDKGLVENFSRDRYWFLYVNPTFS